MPLRASSVGCASFSRTSELPQSSRDGANRGRRAHGRDDSARRRLLERGAVRSVRPRDGCRRRARHHRRHGDRIVGCAGRCARRVDRRLFLAAAAARTAVAVVGAIGMFLAGLAVARGWFTNDTGSILPTLLMLGGLLLVVHGVIALLNSVLPAAQSVGLLVAVTIAQPFLELAAVLVVLWLALGAVAVFIALLVAAAMRPLPVSSRSSCGCRGTAARSRCVASSDTAARFSSSGSASPSSASSTNSCCRSSTGWRAWHRTRSL